MSDRSIGEGLTELSAGVMIGAAAAAFFLSMAQCESAGKAHNARRYEACMRATSSVAQCGKP
jgi:hypothetical protein